jgi:hypothetical protein
MNIELKEKSNGEFTSYIENTKITASKVVITKSMNRLKHII